MIWSTLTHAFKELDTLSAAEAAADAGFQYVELWRGHADGLAEATRYDDVEGAAKQLDNELAKRGLSVSSYCVGGIADESIETIEKWAAFAKALGTNVLTGCLLKPERAKDLDRALARFGVYHAIENHKGIHFEGIRPYEELFENGRFPNLGINVDTGHFLLAGVDILEALRRLSGRVRHVHLKDIPRPDQTDYQHSCPLGTGQLDVTAVIEGLREIGYEGPVSVEYEDRDAKEALKQSVDYLRRCELISQGA